ncbi:MAG: flagellar basal body L-ring protein FlgH [Candidatus Manganitrophaceae bacterium]
MNRKRNDESLGHLCAFVPLCLCAFLFVGCAAANKEIRPVESIPTVYREPIALHKTEGSLWTDDQSRVFLFQDAKASHVGDIVTIRIVENAKGSKGAQTKSGRNSTVAAGTNAFLGIPSVTTSKLQADANFSDSFDGNGSTSRSGALTADLTAVVTAVFPNGNMAVEGRREVLINNEKEFIVLSGIIRPEDVGPRNTILSTFISDARIEYSGQGVLNDKQRPGWLVRILDWIWPF